MTISEKDTSKKGQYSTSTREIRIRKFILRFLSSSSVGKIDSAIDVGDGKQVEGSTLEQEDVSILSKQWKICSDCSDIFFIYLGFTVLSSYLQSSKSYTLHLQRVCPLEY